jgi:hypothetical protein
MNDTGTYLQEGNFVLDGTFVDDIVDGPTKISWQKKANFDGTVKQGRIDGDGSYYTKDGSYVYQGIYLFKYLMYQSYYLSISNHFLLSRPLC